MIHQPDLAGNFPRAENRRTSLPCSPVCVPLSVSLTLTRKHIYTHTPTHTKKAHTSSKGKGVSWISFYTSKNWPNGFNYGITWAKLIHHCNYLASAPSHTYTHRHTQMHTCCDNRRCWSNTVGHLEWKEEPLVFLWLPILLCCSLCSSSLILLISAPLSSLSPVSAFLSLHISFSLLHAAQKSVSLSQ